jgi:Uma2 family endonuclease
LIVVRGTFSPGTARVDRGPKRELYQRAGVPEYWIVDHEARLVERWRPSDVRPEILRGTLVWHPEGAVKPLALDLPALFAQARGA